MGIFFGTACPNDPLNKGSEDSDHPLPQHKWQFQDGPSPQQKSPETQIHHDEFCCTASRAFCGAVKLATLCSSKSRAELQSAFNLSISETGGEPWGDDAFQGQFF